MSLELSRELATQQNAHTSDLIYPSQTPSLNQSNVTDEAGSKLNLSMPKILHPNPSNPNPNPTNHTPN